MGISLSCYSNRTDATAFKHDDTINNIDILSLPNEMLALVLKYSKFDDLTKMRRLSCRVDSLSKRYNLDKMNVESLCVTFEEGDAMTVELKDKNALAPSIRKFSATSMAILKYYFEKVRCLNKLKLVRKGSTKIGISDEFGQLILGKSCKSLTHLTICQCDLIMSFDIMRKILTKPNLTMISFIGTFLNFTPFDQLVEGVELDQLQLINQGPGWGITVRGLQSACEKRLPFALMIKVRSPVLEVGQCLERVLENGMHNNMFWHLYIENKTMAVDDVAPYFSKLECFKKCTVTADISGEVVDLEMRDNDSPMSVIKLRVAQ